MSKQHRVRTHHWYDGILEVKDFVFDAFEDALEFALSVLGAESVKIHDHEDRVVHEIGSTGTDSYA